MTCSADQFPLFSVVTIVLNDSAGFAKTAASILSQDPSLFEWVVTDGGSQDGTVDIIKQYANRIRDWVSERDGGIYDAMNRSIVRCRGRFLIFMHAGDEFSDPGVLSAVASYLAKAEAAHMRPNLIAGAANIVFANGITVHRPAQSLEKNIWHRMPAYHQATFFDREMIAEHPFDLTYRINGDYAHMCQLYMVGLRPLYIKRDICRFAAGGASSRNWRKLLFEAVRIQRQILRQQVGWIALSFVRRLIWLCFMNITSLIPVRRHSRPSAS